jgi:hypothetical protein
MNMLRRHLTDDQRAVIFAKFGTMGQGTRTDIVPIGARLPGLSNADAADKGKVSKRTLQRGKALVKADPALAEEVASGKKKLAVAVKEAGTKQAVTPKLPPAPKQSKKAWEAEQRKLSDERFEKSAAILEEFCKAYFDVPAWGDIVPKIQGTLHALGRDRADPPPFDLAAAS